MHRRSPGIIENGHERNTLHRPVASSLSCVDHRRHCKLRRHHRLDGNSRCTWRHRLGAFADLGGVPVAAVGVALTAWVVFDKTGSVAAAIAAGLLAILAAIYIHFVVDALVFSILAGTGIFAAIAFLYVVTVIVTALVLLLTWLLTITAELRAPLRRRMYAYIHSKSALAGWVLLNRSGYRAIMET